jgi:hypothetical protein
MRDYVRRLLLIVCALALVGGSALGFAIAPAQAAAPCAHEHNQGPGNASHHHDHGAPGCLLCCLGACAAIPDLPPRPVLSEAPVTVVAVIYWEFGTALAGRSIAPDPAPPKSIA